MILLFNDTLYNLQLEQLDCDSLNSFQMIELAYNAPTI